MNFLLNLFHGSSGIEIQVLYHTHNLLTLFSYTFRVTEQTRITQALPMLANTFSKDSREEHLYYKMSSVKHET